MDAFALYPRGQNRAQTSLRSLRKLDCVAEPTITSTEADFAHPTGQAPTTVGDLSCEGRWNLHAGGERTGAIIRVRDRAPAVAEDPGPPRPGSFIRTTLFRHAGTSPAMTDALIAGARQLAC